MSTSKATRVKRKPNLPELRRALKIARKVPADRLRMFQWISEEQCGTVGCIVGHYCRKTPKSLLRLDSNGEPSLKTGSRTLHRFAAVAKHFCLTKNQAGSVFLSTDNGRLVDGSDYERKAFYINRLAKFIAKLETA